MFDAVVIGAGVVGAMTARTLTSYGMKVCIVEKENDVAMGATKANSAIVHAGFDAKEGSLKAQLNVRGSEMMAEVAKELGVKYINNGSLVIGFNDEDKETIKGLYERGVKNGVKNLSILTGEEARALEPNLSDSVTCALNAPTGAIICPYELTIAAVGNAMDNGAELKLNSKVLEIKKNEETFEVVTDKETICAKIVVNAAGVYSDEVAKMVGDDSFTINPRRGEYILLDREEGGLVSHTIFRTPSKMGKGILVSPTVDHNLLLGPTSVDIEDKEDTNTTSEGFAKVIREANENVKSLALNKAITSFCGLRATGSTGDFIINSPVKGFFNAAGVESPGLSSAPAIAEYIAQLIKEQGYNLEKDSSFNPIRKNMHYFKEATLEEKNEIIKKDSSFGKIVCRCETVTEGEILEAIRTNPRPTDLDGVKRRTRAQMGRCQGGFCMPYIVELLAKENNIAYEAVTKFGGNSTVNFGKTKEALKND
ncbi:MAG: NAD(P)/FAD-dependent oxidoreductase [Clostridia bacterium]|nr:NAD(P)/FAD-dependent oxidoreductase [Clostridia bacterium]